MGDTRVQTLSEFYEMFRLRDWGPLRRLLAEDVEFGLSGRGPFAGTYRGADAAIDALRSLVDDTDDTLGPVREDTWDICVSDHHAILIEWLQATRQGRKANFYIHLVCAFDDGKIKRAFASFDSQYGFDELWSGT